MVGCGAVLVYAVGRELGIVSPRARALSLAALFNLAKQNTQDGSASSRYASILFLRRHAVALRGFDACVARQADSLLFTSPWRAPTADRPKTETKRPETKDKTDDRRPKWRSRAVEHGKDQPVWLWGVGPWAGRVRANGN
jgi:hypothetical protein